MGFGVFLPGMAMEHTVEEPEYLYNNISGSGGVLIIYYYYYYVFFIIILRRIFNDMKRVRLLFVGNLFLLLKMGRCLLTLIVTQTSLLKMIVYVK